MERLWQRCVVEGKDTVSNTVGSKWKIRYEKLRSSRFCTACPPEYWQSDSHPPDRRLERPSSWNLTSLREKETKDYGIWIFYPTCPAILPYHIEYPVPLFIMSRQSESPGNEENHLLLEPKTALYKTIFGEN